MLSDTLRLLQQMALIRITQWKFLSRRCRLWRSYKQACVFLKTRDRWRSSSSSRTAAVFSPQQTGKNSNHEKLQSFTRFLIFVKQDFSFFYQFEAFMFWCFLGGRKKKHDYRANKHSPISESGLASVKQNCHMSVNKQQVFMGNYFLFPWRIWWWQIYS